MVFYRKCLKISFYKENATVHNLPAALTKRREKKRN